MSTQTPIRFIYLGRQKTFAQEIENVWRGATSAASSTATSTVTHRPLLPLRVLWVSSQKQAMETLSGLPCHAILLEIQNHLSRTRFCQDLRRRFPALPIIAVHSEPLRAEHFAFDETMRWPLRASARETLLRTVNSRNEPTQLRIGPIHLDLTTRTVYGPRGKHQLPRKQCDLLKILMTHGNDIISRETIMRLVWETEYVNDTRTIDVHMHWLRKKIEPDPSAPIYLITVRGLGYRLATP